MPIKHSILMITYNQEDYIEEALSSLFKQGVMPHEIVISDDASTDKTAEIIVKYQKKYPGIIKPIFQKENLGINQNLNFIINSVKIEGDIVSFLAGDDFFEDGMLAEFNGVAEKNLLDPHKNKFIILSNSLILDSVGNKTTYTNNYKLIGKNYIKLKLRNKIGSRYTGFSRALYDQLGDWNQQLGLWADALHSFDAFCKCDHFYFINKYFPVYRLGSGITSEVSRATLDTSWIKVANFFIEKRRGNLDALDIIYLKKSIYKHHYGFHRNLTNWVCYFFYYWLSILDVITGYNSLKDFLIEFSNFLPKPLSDQLRVFYKKVVYGRKN